MRTVVRRIENSDGKRRVEIFRNLDGTFSFDEFLFDELDRAFCFVRDQHRSAPRTASFEECLKEAKGRVPWLAELTVE